MKPIIITNEMFKIAKRECLGLPNKTLYSDERDNYKYSIIISSDKMTSMINFVILIETNQRVYRRLDFPTNIFYDDIGYEDFIDFYEKDLKEVADKMNKYLEFIQTTDEIECAFDSIRFE